MDYFRIHLESLPRQYPMELSVGNIGYLPRKREWVSHEFSSFNFSFILRGGGVYRKGGRTWAVNTPCVITQWPGLHVEYGPEDEWEELYLIYRAELQPSLEARRFADPDRPVWYVREAASLRRRLVELMDLFKDLQAFGRADEIDRVCERMIFESLISESRPSLTPLDQTILEIRSFVEEHFTEWIDFDFLAAEHGLSPATFRRHWARHVSLPPSNYVTHLRMQQACRMLAETPQPVGDIARAVGYEDVLYFSRRFRGMVGETASEYRKRNQFHAS
ncbi:MAG: helix-turn-helix transcriptional regulator [Phycisphaerae bacterium]|nr:helix-turn-helix transcriptional regulator [Phycisphaerae bacterium]